jgi:hypothetical protein
VPSIALGHREKAKGHFVAVLSVPYSDGQKEKDGMKKRVPGKGAQ